LKLVHQRRHLVSGNPRSSQKGHERKQPLLAAALLKTARLIRPEFTDVAQPLPPPLADVFGALADEPMTQRRSVY